MATISLYASRINQMPELLKTTMNNSVAFQNSLKDLNKKILKIDNSACDVYNEAGIVQASVNTQEVISGSIGKLQNTVDEFITDTVNIDNNAADLINRNKNDFYEKYSYLKPTCEKNFWEKAKGSLSKAWEWCKKNWKIVVTAVLVIAAIAILVFCPAAGLGLLALAAAKGVLVGAALGAVIGGVFSGLIAWRTGKPIWEAVKEGAIDGAMWGAIFGVVAGFGSLAGQILGKSCTALAKYESAINCAAKVLNGIDMAFTGFDLLSFGAIMYDPECGWAKFYNKLSSNTFFNILQFGAGLGGTFAHGMKSGIKFDRDHGLSKCFVAGTLVSTFAGFRAIETIKAGDMVLSADENTGEISYQKVVETYVRETMKLVHLRVNGEEIITTEGHPFYVRELGFVKASELAAGDLLTDSSGNDMPVESVHTEITNIPVTVYNFQVEKTHTYFVTEVCLLVHNGDYVSNYKIEKIIKDKGLDPESIFADVSEKKIEKEYDSWFEKNYKKEKAKFDKDNEVPISEHKTLVDQFNKTLEIYKRKNDIYKKKCENKNMTDKQFKDFKRLENTVSKKYNDLVTLHDQIRKLEKRINTKATETMHEYLSLQKYTYNGKKTFGGYDKWYQKLNEQLRNSQDGKLNNYSLQKHSENISRAISNFELNHDIICYRATKENHYSNVKVGETFSAKQFLSTSISKKCALGKNNNPNFRFKTTIIAPKGSKCAYVANLSEFPNQKEVLFDKTCKYRVLYKTKENTVLEVISSEN